MSGSNPKSKVNLMKKRLIFLLCALCLGTAALAQNYYTIMIGTFLDAKPQDFDPIRPLGLVYAYPTNGNLSQVYLGGFDDKAKAEEVAQNLKQRGYANASVQERRLSDGKTVTVIQMATRVISKEIEWEEFEKIGNLYAILNGDRVKIMTGLYANVNEAKQELAKVRNSGYSDAFVKNVNSNLLVKIGEFETGIKKALIPLSFDQQSTQGRIVTQPDNRPRTNNSNIPDDVPTGYDNSAVTARSPVAARTANVNIPEAPTSKKMSMPDIRVKVKRRSVLELQKILKAEKAYTSSLDGYYGKGTEAAYDEVMATNRELQKYLHLAETMEGTKESGAGNSLQRAINNLPTEASAPTTIESSSAPVAKAYQAYLLYNTLGPSNEVNNLMNSAIKGAYSGKKLQNQPPFDYNATYAYQDLGQMIQHLFYIHAAPGNNYAVPCWLYDRHPRETAKAQAAFAGYDNNDLKLQACDQFLDWPEIKVLQAIAADMNTDSKVNTGRLSADASKRAHLFTSPQALNASEAKTIESWNTDLWNNLNAWSSRDPIHQRVVVALKVAYFQSQVRLEDYFMDQGFSADESKGLALATLETLVGYYLDRFV